MIMYLFQNIAIFVKISSTMGLLNYPESGLNFLRSRKFLTGGSSSNVRAGVGVAYKPKTETKIEKQWLQGRQIGGGGVPSPFFLVCPPSIGFLVIFVYLWRLSSLISRSWGKSNLHFSLVSLGVTNAPLQCSSIG